jgi:hypothetical protein
MKNAQLGGVMDAIAVELFGLDAYDSGTMIKTELHSFVSTLLSYLWNQVRKSTKSQFNRLEKGKVEAARAFESKDRLPRRRA